MKYSCWVSLNDEGMKVWGDVFPSGMIPTRGIAPANAKLEDKKMEVEVYMVDWKELTEELKNGILEKLCKKFKAPREAILQQIKKDGLPLQAKYVSGAAADLRFFI